MKKKKEICACVWSTSAAAAWTKQDQTMLTKST